MRDPSWRTRTRSPASMVVPGIALTTRTSSTRHLAARSPLLEKGRTLTRKLVELPVGPMQRYGEGSPYGKHLETEV